ncbi:amidohydrolase family protein [Leisingera daeponensis]|uniref:amidohydrolase family protein n=1 Tax=Leisingera daeponensis TaxID=405746 RepID=UPI00041F2390|nr:amidohydrolase family protein [Leisingera daeponensis]
MRRRDFIKQVTISSAALASGCGQGQLNSGTPGAGQAFVDAHCHVFNASDLPTVRFLRQVVFKRYPKQALMRSGVRDPDALDVMIEFMVELLGAGAAPSADQEIAVLEGRESPKPSATTAQAARASAIEDMAQFLRTVDARRRARGPEIASAPTEQLERKQVGDTAFLNFFLDGQSRERVLTNGEPLTLQEARAASRRAFKRSGGIATYLNWFSLFRMYRHALADELIADAERQEFEMKVMTPLLVDFDEWLYQDVESSMAKQVRVMELVAQRAALASDKVPVVLNFVGYDPLREVAFRAGTKGSFSSLEIARKALTESGFAGVKLYPPMGFRASGNRGPYPRRTLKKLGFEPSHRLDETLDDLYSLCAELDAPIMAHGAASNGAGEQYDIRADPAYWIPVFEKHPELRVCLAHFGGFDKKSYGQLGPLPDSSWEWVLGRYIKAHPQQPVFVDISYMSEALGSEIERTNLATNLKAWVQRYDPKIRHIIYGSDWIMVGKERGYENYLSAVASFLKDECGFDEGARERVLYLNALRFLPFQRLSTGRQRLSSWYRANGLDPRKLPTVPPSLLQNFFGE